MQGRNLVSYIYDGEVIMLVLNNDGDMSHPFHLHGHRFWVLGNGAEYAGNYVPETMASLLNYDNPTQRDTQQIQAHSWMVLLFEADNPGVWFFHCHIEWHVEAGLAMVFVESEDQLSAPPGDLPYFTTYAERTCSDDDGLGRIKGGLDAIITLSALFAVTLLGIFFSVFLLRGPKRAFFDQVLSDGERGMLLRAVQTIFIFGVNIGAQFAAFEVAV